MFLKFFITKIFSFLIHKQTIKWSINPFITQKKIFDNLIKSAKGTFFEKKHNLNKVKTYEDFKKAVPIRDYELYRPYINRIILGEKNILFKGSPIYFAKTSGTTSGIKYIPITKTSLMYQIISARNALLEYIYITGKNHFFNKKMIFLQGSPNLNELSGIKVGRLSGIVAHHVPKYLKYNILPSWNTNCIEDWEEKIEKIVEETINEDMGLISGIPPWINMYLEKLKNKSGKKIDILFPNINLIITGGVNYTPYDSIIQDFFHKKIDIIQIYSASEGFIAYQNKIEDNSLLLLLNHGIFYEFIPLNDILSNNPIRINIEDVELGIDYVLIMNTHSGLWGYNIGDTIRFVSKQPYKIIITGRLHHFISAFGEHVISHEVEYALYEAKKKQNCTIVDFTVAPKISKKNNYHEWYIEFGKEPKNINLFAQELDLFLRKKNIYYNDLIKSKILKPLVIKKIKKDGIKNYMKSIGKLGGQNKIPRLSNNRNIVSMLDKYLLY